MGRNPYGDRREWRRGDGVRTVCLVVAAILLAGCATENDSDGETAQDVDIPRAAIIEVALDGTTRSPVNGTVEVPSGIDVTFNGTSSVGAEGNYTWDFGDNTTATGVVVEHAFEPGRFEVALTVGVNGTASQRMAIESVESAPPSGVSLGTQPFAFSDSLPLGNPNTATAEGTDYRDHVVTIADATDNGTAAVAGSVGISLTSSGGAVQTFLYWISPDGETLASGTASDSDQVIEHDEPMPAGDYVVRVRVFVGAMVDYTVEGEVDYVTP